MSADNDPSLLKLAVDYLWALLAVPIATLWKKADNALPKSEFAEYAAESREDRRQLLASIEKVFDKVDELKDDNHEQALRVMAALDKKADK